MLEVLVISAIISFIVDISGVIDSIKYAIWRWAFDGEREYKDFNLKPFDCSLCMTFWVGLIYIIITGFSIWLLLWVCFCALISNVLGDIMLMIKDLLIKGIDKIEKTIK